jgi:NAD(P)-dependent dehydrogenase (short-subunit alcohol dehydrogenase family)
MSAAGLAGKVAVITGAGRAGGIGAAIGRRLAADGCHVILSDIAAPDAGVAAAEELHARVGEIRAAHGDPAASAMVCDVTDEPSIKAMFAAIEAEHGRLDIVINNAGIGFLMSPLVETTSTDWDRVLDVNLRGAFLVTKYAAPVMIAGERGGRVINIASQAAKSGFPHAAAYVSSKHGMIGLTRVAAIELAANQITVNAVCPNHITTGLGSWQNKYFSALFDQSEQEYLAAMRARIPLGRPGKVEDIAAICAFLCSDEAAYITGEAINVSGGEEMH